jgi:hypothetical protein
VLLAAAGGSPSPSGAAAPSSRDLGASIHQLAGTITGLIDTPLAMISHAIAGLSATVGQIV